MNDHRPDVVDRFGRRVPTEPVVALHVDRTPGHRPLHVDGVPVDLRRGTDPHRAGLAAAADRARVLGRPVRVRMSSPWSEWPLVVHPDGSVDDARDPSPAGPPGASPAPARAVAAVPARASAWTGSDGGGARGGAVRGRATALAGAWERPRRRPVGAVAAACALAAALLVGAVGTGVATLGATGAAPAECRPVTLFAMGGDEAGAADTLSAVTDPLVQNSGDKLAVVTAPPPAGGAGYAAAEQQAVTQLAGSVTEQLAACPASAAMLFGHSEGAHVVGDVAARIGAGQVAGVEPGRILAVGLFGDPARSSETRVVPDGASGQGILPPRPGGFGALDAKTIQICAPDDPVCATTPSAAAPTLEQALAAPAHAGYAQLPVAEGTPATAWASESLGRLIASLPAAGVDAEQTGSAASSTTGAAPVPGGTGAATSSTTGAAPVPGTAPGAATTTQPGVGATTVPPLDGTAQAPAVVPTRPPRTGRRRVRRRVRRRDRGVRQRSRGGRRNDRRGRGRVRRRGGGVRRRRRGGRRGVRCGRGRVRRRSRRAGRTVGRRGNREHDGPPGDDRPHVRPGRHAAPLRTAPARGTGTGADTGTGAGADTGGTAAGGTGGAIDDPSVVPTTPPSEAGSSTGSRPTGRSGSTTTTTTGGRSGETSARPTTTTAGGGDRSGTSASDGGTATDGGADTGTDTGALWSLTSGLEGFQSSNGGNVEGGGRNPQAVPSPNVPGRTVVKLQVPPGGKRSEVRPEEAQNIRAGQHLFFGYSAFLPADFPVDARSWQVIWQLHDGGTNTSPPVALEVVDGKLWLSNVGDRVRDLGPVSAGQNLDVQLDITFAQGGGSVSVYRGGQQVLQDFRPPRGTMIDGSDFLKTGVYRDPNNGGGGATLFLNDLKIGESLESVSALAGAGGDGGSLGAEPVTGSDPRGATPGTTAVEPTSRAPRGRTGS